MAIGYARSATIQTGRRLRLDKQSPKTRGKRSSSSAPAKSTGESGGLGSGFDLLAYQRDVAERWILFLDTLRQRADDMLAHERAGKPPLLDFDYELLLDARRFERPANYALLRITRIGDACLEDCVDLTKPPVMIVDPRAGHGPGIGGFKRDSEVGVALHAGHPVYFVVFFPEPCPGQTLTDVLHALRQFVKEISRRHGDTPPILYGNCQAGWALTILAADCQGLAGPVVLNGSPLSYWAGESGVNPMRVAGGLLGGAWLTHLAADLGGGRFDGAWLAQNFEILKPEVAWDKYAHLFSKVDTERERFLDFERWWGGYYFLSREEIMAIVENLFVGNRLEQGTLHICDCCFVDLRRIQNPMIIFASHGDDITPPHQALGWIPVVYRDTDDLKRAGQRIVYLINPHVGHLGIFVSASVAKLEHRVILESMNQIAAQPPGLYEMKIDNPMEEPDCRTGEYAVRFEERRVEDLRFPVDRPAFQRVATVSESLDAAYGRIVSPWVQAAVNPMMTAMLEWLHPMRLSRYAFGSSFNPFMSSIAIAASAVRAGRHAVPEDAALKKAETAIFDRITKTIAQGRRARDSTLEQLFESLYASGPRRRAGSTTAQNLERQGDSSCCVEHACRMDEFDEERNSQVAELSKSAGKMETSCTKTQ